MNFTLNKSAFKLSYNFKVLKIFILINKIKRILRKGQEQWGTVNDGQGRECLDDGLRVTLAKNVTGR